MNTSTPSSVALSSQSTRQSSRQPSSQALAPAVPSFNFFDTHALDRIYRANLAHVTGGISPAGISSLWFNWLMHLAISPGKQMRLLEKYMRKITRWYLFTTNDNALSAKGNRPASSSCIAPLPQDKRFNAKEWQMWPYNIIYQGFLLQQQWWCNATTDIDGLSEHEQNVLFFVVRQLLDHYSPSNFPWSNPEIQKTTLEQGGVNLWLGWRNFVEDSLRVAQHKKPIGAEDFPVGEKVAVTPGKVVYRNHLIELIQYTPSTEKVYQEPILIVPAWIMKYYILDLSPHNSLVKYLVDQGHTVFMISWRNPDSHDRDIGLDDYRRLGIMEALNAINKIVPQQKVHALGYCLGGTLLAIAAATMARDHDERLQTMATLATQVDFSEAGELMQFISESEVAYLESMMWEQGYLDGSQMAGAFQLLRSNDLIWSRIVNAYFLGKRQPMNDLMAWNADTTRMPYRMHSEYLRKIFLHNDLAKGRLIIEDRPINLADLRIPVFAVGTTQDHVAPWKSVYKITVHPAIDVTFLLTSGGHNAGIISEPGHPHRTYQIATDHAGATYVDPETWQSTVAKKKGSWWPELHRWLVEHSAEKTQTSPPQLGAPEQGLNPLMDAPGSYVFQR